MLALVVDDSRPIRMIMRRILNSNGLAVVEADNGAVALEVLRQGETLPAVALVDWNMPVLDGLELITAVRAEPLWRDITLMMVTTEGEEAQIVRALAAGAHEYVVKPFTPEIIADKLSVLGLTPAT
jgi:two-component system chemotaxis response regulator CheY